MGNDAGGVEHQRKTTARFCCQTRVEARSPSPVASHCILIVSRYARGTMKRVVKTLVRVAVLGLGLGVLGCGTTRSTDTTRAATEMLLVSQAVDRAVSHLDFSPLAGKAVFLDVSNIDQPTVDKGYVVSSLRQQLLANGAMLMEDKNRAAYVVEARTGAIGTDRHTLLFGTPQLAVPAVVPGLPSQIPEIALYKRTDQKGVAKLAVFAYNRTTGRAVWQSGLVEETSRQKDRWVLGSGPYTNGTIQRHTTLAGEDLPDFTSFPQLPIIGKEEPTPNESLANQAKTQEPGLLPTEKFQWVNGDAPPPPQPVPLGLTSITGIAPIINHPLLTR
jgi:hypothetical protein